MQLSAVPPGQLADAFRRELVGQGWDAIDDVKWRYDTKAAASVLSITGIQSIDWNDDGGGAHSMALPGGGFTPPSKRIRSTGQDQGAPFSVDPDFVCSVTTVRVPAASDPRHWSSKAGIDNSIFGRRYYRAFELRDGAIRMVRSSRAERPEIDAAAALRDNDLIPAFDNSMGYINYDPAALSTGVGSGERVPATYDIDWTASDVPCSKEKRRD